MRVTSVLRMTCHLTLPRISTIMFTDSASHEDCVRPDKDWSLTDCISFVVMNAESISEALTGDEHFEQAGFVALLR
jgi:predicted nucleic acid-binding protein